jgi:hypothetical protein
LLLCLQSVSIGCYWFAVQIRVDGQVYGVCQRAFVSIHAITKSRLLRLTHHLLSNSTPPTDKRGKHRNRGGAIPETILHKIDTFIKSIPKRTSHYSRRDQRSKKYFTQDIGSIAELHRLYCKEHPSQSVKYNFFREYFIIHYNISFGRPRSDTCGYCDELKLKLELAVKDSEKKIALIRDKELHLRKAEAFYVKLKDCSAKAKTDRTVETISFDFQQNLPLPHLPVSEIFYARQLWVYNFCIHTASSDDAHMYMWCEGDAKRGCNEVLSCLHDYIVNKLREEVKTLFIFSDACAGQNRNKTMMQYLYTLVRNKNIKAIEHTYPTRGHSFLPCDRDFALIEKLKRSRDTVYTFNEWAEIVESARPNHPFVVVKVLPDLIKDYQSHLSRFFKQSVTNILKERLMLSKVKCLSYNDNHSTEVLAFETAQSLIPQRFIIEKPNARVSLPVAQMYRGIVPIKAAKQRDIKRIVDKYVPQPYRAFYYARLNADEEPPADGSDEVDSSDSEADSDSDVE